MQQLAEKCDYRYDYLMTMLVRYVPEPLTSGAMDMLKEFRAYNRALGAALKVPVEHHEEFATKALQNPTDCV